MLEAMDNVITTRILFESAFEAHLSACSALRKGCMMGGPLPAELGPFARNELALLTNRETKVHQAKALIGATVNHSVSVNTLPPEILSYIFHLVPLEPLYNVPMNFLYFPKRLEYISHTCSHWRHVALDTPSLWTSVCFVLQLNANDGLISRANLYASRARGLPLHVDIRGHRWMSNSVIDSASASQQVDLMLEFLTSVTHRISSVKLVGPLRDSEPFRKFLEACLAGATPGTLTRLALADTFSEENVSIGSARDSSQMPGLALDIPAQHIEDILGSVTSLSLQAVHFPWASTAFHGLEELHLSSDFGFGTTFSEAQITESHLHDILLSSPGLRIFTFDMNIQASRSNNDPVTPVVLEHLEVLDLRGLNAGRLGTVLQLLTPGSKLYRIWLDFADADLCDSRLNEALKLFFGRAHVPKLGLTNVKSLQWLGILRGLVTQTSLMTLYDLNIDGALDDPVVQWGNSPTALDFGGHLHLPDSLVSLTHLSWILDAYRPRTLTLWQFRAYLNPEDLVEGEELIKMLSQRYSYVGISEHDESDPVWDDLTYWNFQGQRLLWFVWRMNLPCEGELQ